MLFRKMLRDMRGHMTQFLSIFIMAFLGVYIFSGIGGEWMGLQSSIDRYYRQTDMADVWVYGNNFTAGDESAVRNIGGGTGAERSLVLNGVGKFSGNPKITLNFVEKGEIAKTYLVSGEAFSTEEDGIWVAERFAKARHLSIGDTLTVTVNGITLKEKIRGTVYSPEYVYMANDGGMAPDFAANGYAYLSVKSFPIKSLLQYNRMLLTTDRNASSIEDAVGKALGGKDSVYLLRKNHPSVSMFQQEIDQHQSMGSIFPLAFVLIALLTMLTTMTRIVTNQRTQIGTLKALGFKKSKITLHYMSYGFWVSLLGSALGAILGPMTLPYLFYPSLSGFYTLPVWRPSDSPSFYLMAAGMVVLCTVVTFVACRRVLQDTPAKTLRPKAPKTARHGLLERMALWKKLGFNLQWNIRDIFRNRIRSVMAVIGVLGCTALLVCAFGLYDDMGDMKNWQYQNLDRFASKLSVQDTATDEQINNVIDKTQGQALMEGAIEIKANGMKKSGSLTVTDHVILQQNTDTDGRIIKLPEDGVSLSYKMANELGVTKGDTIKWHLYGSDKWVSTKIAAVYRDPTEQGITLTRESFSSLGYTFRATSILSAQTVETKYAGVASIQHKDDLIRDWDKMTESMMTMVFILIAAAALLAVVVLYNLGILSFTEMERELATLKVVGLKSRKIRRLLLSQNLILSAVGFILGIPAGKWLIDSMVDTMGDSFDMITSIHISNLLLSLAITACLSLLVNVMFANKIRRLDMVGSLKGVE